MAFQIISQKLMSQMTCGKRRNKVMYLFISVSFFIRSFVSKLCCLRLLPNVKIYGYPPNILTKDKIIMGRRIIAFLLSHVFLSMKSKILETIVFTYFKPLKLWFAPGMILIVWFGII